MAIQLIEAGASNGGDAPIHVKGQPGETSSLGLFWPPKETDFHRVKGFYRKAILNPTDFDAFRQTWDGYLNSPRFTTDGVESGTGTETNFSRLTMRAVVSDDFLWTNAAELRESVEAIIPLEEGSPFAGTSLVYFGANQADRKSDENTMATCEGNLRTALGESPRTPQQMLARAQLNGYDVALTQADHTYSLDDKVAGDLYKLYKPFGWTPDQVLELLNSPQRMLATASKEGEVVSAGIAEMGSVAIEFGSDQQYPLDIVELTDAATLVEHEGRGLYSAVSTELLKQLAQQYKGSPSSLIILGESNASALGVLKTARHQGRTFATEVGTAYGYNQSGMLHQHVPILDRGESLANATHQYNNFFPTFINSQTLYGTYLSD